MVGVRLRHSGDWETIIHLLHFYSGLKRAHTRHLGEHYIITKRKRIQWKIVLNIFIFNVLRAVVA